LDNDQNIDDYNFKVDAHNITEAITGITNWFNKEGNYDTEFVVQTVRKNQMRKNGSD